MQHSDFYTAQDGTQIWYGTVGRGPHHIILCDGLACDGFIWPYFIDHFCDDFTIVRWHYRGHGLSEDPPHLENLTLEHICNDLHGIMSELSIESAILGGHSMGVQVILQYYDYFPDQVKALIPMCGSYKHPLDTFHNNDHLRKALPYLDKFLGLAPDALQNLWETLLPNKIWYLVAANTEVNGRLLRRKDFLPYFDHASKMNLKVFLQVMVELSEHNAEDVLPTIAAPTLIIAGEDDTFTPLFCSEDMHAAIPQSELVIVPCGTHVAPLELPDLVNAAVEKFLVQHNWMNPTDAAHLLANAK